MSLLDIATGGKGADAVEAQKKALDLLNKVNVPTIGELTLPELEQYAVAMNMSPAQMQAFLQESNAFNDQNIDQQGTDAQIRALNQLAQVADAGAEGSPTQRAQVEQINQDAARNLAGQRGAIDQQAQARGVPPGLLQAALQSQRAGETQQNAHMAALNSQSNAYQQALQAMAQGGALGGQLQGQQNAQANTRAAAQNAMQQFNAANQQNASAANANMQQQANAYNTNQTNNTSNANTGLTNDRTRYNANLPQQNYQNQMQKAGAMASGYGNLSNAYQNQANMNSAIMGALTGASGSFLGISPSGGQGLGAGNTGQSSQSQSAQSYGGSEGPPDSSQATTSYFTNLFGMADGGIVDDGACMKNGGMIPGKPRVAGDSKLNDTVPIRVSPGEAVIPRTAVQQNPMDVMRLLAGRPQSTPRPGEPMPHAGSGMAGHSPEDIAALLQAMKHLRGTH